MAAYVVPTPVCPFQLECVFIDIFNYLEFFYLFQALVLLIPGQSALCAWMTIVLSLCLSFHPSIQFCIPWALKHSILLQKFTLVKIWLAFLFMIISKKNIWNKDLSLIFHFASIHFRWTSQNHIGSWMHCCLRAQRWPFHCWLLLLALMWKSFSTFSESIDGNSFCLFYHSCNCMLRNCLKLSDMAFYWVMSLLPSFLVKDLPFGQVFLSIPQPFLLFVVLTQLINPIVALRNFILCKSSLKSFELNVAKVLEKYNILLQSHCPIVFIYL